MTLTLTLKTLSNEPIDKWSTMITECKTHEVVYLEPMWNVNVEALSCHLVTHRQIHQPLSVRGAEAVRMVSIDDKRRWKSYKLTSTELILPILTDILNNKQQSSFSTSNTLSKSRIVNTTLVGDNWALLHVDIVRFLTKVHQSELIRLSRESDRPLGIIFLYNFLPFQLTQYNTRSPVI